MNAMNRLLIILVVAGFCQGTWQVFHVLGETQANIYAVLTK